MVLITSDAFMISMYLIQALIFMSQRDHFHEDQEIHSQRLSSQEINDEREILEEDGDFLSDQEEKSAQFVDMDAEPEKLQNQHFDVEKIKNPVSPYMVFVNNWKKQHPSQKMKLSAMGEAWRSLSQSEISFYTELFRKQKQKYDEYIARMMTIDPNFLKKSQKRGKSYLFPLHRVRNILKQDSDYNPKGEAISCLSLSTQYFAEYFLQEVKKFTEGKKKIDLSDMFECIHSGPSNLWFLECLADEYVQKHGDGKKSQQKRPLTIDVENEEDKKVKKENKSAKKPKQSKQSQKKALPKGQLRLTDMF